jgi:hypothetical protein
MNGMPRLGIDCKRFAFLKAIPLGLISLLGALVLSWSGHLMAQTTDPLLDFLPVMPPQGEKNKLSQPVVSWLVRPDAAQYCEQVKDHDGFGVWQEGCAYWSKAKPSCTIVTTGKTTHSQMGHLFILCMRAGEAS